MTLTAERPPFPAPGSYAFTRSGITSHIVRRWAVGSGQAYCGRLLYRPTPVQLTAVETCQECKEGGG